MSKIEFKKAVTRLLDISLFTKIIKRPQKITSLSSRFKRCHIPMNFKNVEEMISTYKFKTNGNYRDYEIFLTDMTREPIFFGAADFKRR